MNLRFLPAESDDIDPLFELNQSLIEQYEDLSSINIDKVLPWIRHKLEEKISEYRAVFLDEQKVGYFHLSAAEDSMLELDDLYIFAPHRGKGIGSEVIRCCIEESERLLKPLMLYVFTRNTAAIRLYERHGFAADAVVSPTRRIMVRPLSSR